MIAADTIAAPARPGVRLSRLILPTEHGSWSFLFEPLVVGSAIAYSTAAPWIALTAIAGFFARQPLKLFFTARNNASLSATALRLGLLFVLLAAGSLAMAVWLAAPTILIPAVIAAPLTALQFVRDIKRPGRSVAAETAGAIAISSTSAMLALAGGLSFASAAILWIVFICRFIPSILYVRNRLLMEKGKPAQTLLPVAVHIIALAVLIGLAAAGHASYLTAGMFGVLAARAAHGLSERRFRMKAMKIGIWEVIYGSLTVTAMIAGHYAGI
jgi:hypothetical protein